MYILLEAYNARGEFRQGDVRQDAFQRFKHLYSHFDRLTIDVFLNENMRR